MSHMVPNIAKERCDCHENSTILQVPCRLDPFGGWKYAVAMAWYLSYPSWMHAEIIPSLPLRWYGFMYVLAFTTTYLLVLWQTRHEEPGWSRDLVDDLFFRCILLLLLGARLVSQLVYDGTWYYWLHPWKIFWPFENGRFVGLAGMSYHGGLVGCLLGGLWFSRKHHKDFLTCCDLACAGIPLGYTFGRIGNFINGELWGRVSTAPWAMVFPGAPGLSTNQAWVRKVCAEAGIAYQKGTLVNLPRHPSQLYEALFEGIVLFLFLWFVIRPRRKMHKSGFVLAWYLIGYGIARFFIEYFRTPDANLGFVISLGPKADTISLFTSLRNISLGQIFCLGMILAGVVLLMVRKGKRKQTL